MVTMLLITKPISVLAFHLVGQFSLYNFFSSFEVSQVCFCFVTKQFADRFNCVVVVGNYCFPNLFHVFFLLQDISNIFLKTDLSKMRSPCCLHVKFQVTISNRCVWCEKYVMWRRAFFAWIHPKHSFCEICWKVWWKLNTARVCAAEPPWEKKRLRKESDYLTWKYSKQYNCFCLT